MREGPLASIRFEGLPEGSMLRYWFDPRRYLGV